MEIDLAILWHACVKVWERKCTAKEDSSGLYFDFRGYPGETIADKTSAISLCVLDMGNSKLKVRRTAVYSSGADSRTLESFAWEETPDPEALMKLRLVL